MRYRLPLELELTILELAAPPLVKSRLAERIKFFIKILRLHRSFTVWAQERLHDQFLYTYRPREGEYARLERRLKEAGFGPTRSIQRLYLDVSRLRRPGDPKPHGFDSEEEDSEASATVETVSASAGTSSSGRESSQVSEGQSNQPASGHGIFEVASFERTLSPLLAHYVQGLDTLWLIPPYTWLDLSDLAVPRLLEVDDEAFGNAWDHLHALPLWQRTTLVLRNTVLVLDHGNTGCPLRTLILEHCRVFMTADFLYNFPDLEILIVCKSIMLNSVQQSDWLPPSARHIHILQDNCEITQEDLAAAATFPALESLTFTWLQPDAAGESGSLAAEVADPLLDLRRFVESSVVAPQCTFKYLRSSKSSEDALADAMADLGLGA